MLSIEDYTGASEARIDKLFLNKPRFIIRVLLLSLPSFVAFRRIVHFVNKTRGQRTVKRIDNPARNPTFEEKI